MGRVQSGICTTVLSFDDEMQTAELITGDVIKLISM